MKDRERELISILILVLSIFVFISLITYNTYEEPTISPNIAISNKMGIIGVYVSYFFIKMTVGYLSIFLPILSGAWGWFLLFKKNFKSLIRTTLFALTTILIFSSIIGLVEIEIFPDESLSFDYSGLIGGVLAKFFIDFLGVIGATLILIVSALLLVGSYFHWSYAQFLTRISTSIGEYISRKKEARELKRREKEKKEHTQDLLEQLKEKEESGIRSDESSNDAVVMGSATQALTTETAQEVIEVSELHIDSGDNENQTEFTAGKKIAIGEEIIEEEIDFDIYRASVLKKGYKLPSVELLDRTEESGAAASHEELVETANVLVQSLQTFGVEGKVVNISPGPVITLYEVEPAEGVRVAKFVQLSDDLARVMKASRVRIIAPIPGKSTVGIEIPNKHPSVVHFRGVISSEKFISSTSKLTVALGKTTSGENFILRLNEMPHLLVAGTTGSGKSVCINTIITSILYQATPDEVRFILIDPKKLEMAPFRTLDRHHLVSIEGLDEYVMTSPENAVHALRSAELEMSRRYDVLANAVVRNIEEFNEKAKKSERYETLPYVVVVIDELADLMLRAQKDVELPIARLAQMARAVGIHLVVATQRPSVDVITGVIKANFPARIAFQVATRVDSRTIIDTIGAEKLIGRGDMLYLPPGSSEPIRLHNSYISLSEINRIVSHVANQPEPEKLMLEGPIGVKRGEGGTVEESLDENDDVLFREAVRLVITHQQGSISLLQRRLRIGYSRAARLIDEMEQIGVVGPFTGSKAREVLVDDTYLERFESNNP